MSLTDKIAEKLAGAFGWLLIRELRGIRAAIETAVDSDREIHGLRPLFKLPEGSKEGSPGEPPEAPEPPPGSSAEEPDYMTLEILGLLAQENGIAVNPDTDLFGLGKERGWLDLEGKLVMLPQGYDR